MPLNFLGKVLFPRLAPWQQKRQLKTMLAVIVVAVVFAAIVGVIIYFTNAKR
jgi:hypothetical protein